jgi:exodeoxyribonuclease V gamma subunit
VEPRPSALRNKAHPLTLYRSNRMERLVDGLAELLADASGDPFTPECILVSGRGMSQWLSLELCRRFGVWANPLYLYPRNFVHWVLERVSPDTVASASLERPLGAAQKLDREWLVWAVLACLRSLLERAEFAVLRQYVAGDASGVRYFELCQQIASTFDQYRTYRPELIEAWEEDDANAGQLVLFDALERANAWQPVLWRHLVRRMGAAEHHLERHFQRGVAQADVARLPPRIVGLGVDNLPPLYTRILVGLCPLVPVYLFQLAPCESGWESPPGRVPRRARAPHKQKVAPSASPAHPLVRSLGTLGHEFESVLREELARQSVLVREPAGLFERPHAGTHLSRLQAEMLGQPHAPEHASAGDDDSIRIHVCHSAMREVEVLHDQLMALLAHGSGLGPEDVVVMMPDVNVYAPLIEAVFQRDSDDGYRIPHHIADRSIRDAAPVVDALARILELTGTRLNAPQVLDLLALEVIARRFDILPQDVERITHWVGLSNIRWGVDADHHEAEGHPRAEANSWRFGLRRLLMGYAVENVSSDVFEDTLPLEAVEGMSAALLGRFCEFLDRLFRHLKAFEAELSPAEWQQTIGAALEDLVLSDADNAWQHQELRDALGELRLRAETAGFAEKLGHRAFSRLLLDAAGAARPGRGFLAKGVTFCSMVPLRSVPFRVVAMLGLGDGEFPRQEHAADFDLIAHGTGERRHGDRSRRNEDRYLFLEGILSARERLIITYTGQNIRDNSELPASVVLSELLDNLARGCERSALVVKHPLQAFSQRYFDGSDARLFSYEEYYKRGAESLVEERERVSPLFPAPLPPPATEEVLPITELVRFFDNPTAHLLNRRLGVWLADREQAVASREPQELTPLDQYGVGNELLELLLREVPEPQIRRMMRASGAVPWGTPGELYVTELMAAAAPVAAAVRAAQRSGRKEPLAVHERLSENCVLSGTLGERFGGDLVRHQFARIKPKHLLRLWILHLVHCLVAEGNAPRAVLIGRPEKLPWDKADPEPVQRHSFKNISDPRAQLLRLCELYQRGQRAPLRLFPATSFNYVKGCLGKEEGKALDFALKVWAEEAKYDAHLQRVFGGGAEPCLPFDVHEQGELAEFRELAVSVFAPLLAHIEPE